MSEDALRTLKPVPPPVDPVVDTPVDLARSADHVDRVSLVDDTVRFRCACGRSVARRGVIGTDGDSEDSCSRCRHRALLRATLQRDELAVTVTSGAAAAQPV